MSDSIFNQLKNDPEIQKAKELIPGGSMLLSKRAEMYLLQGWPAYFDRTQGCSIWDLDGREFTDLSLMGVLLDCSVGFVILRNRSQAIKWEDLYETA